MARTFVYQGQTYPDPDPTMSVDEVRRTLADFMPELTSADATETLDGDNTVIEFKRKVGTKGAG